MLRECHFFPLPWKWSLGIPSPLLRCTCFQATIHPLMRWKGGIVNQCMQNVGTGFHYLLALLPYCFLISPLFPPPPPIFLLIPSSPHLPTCHLLPPFLSFVSSPTPPVPFSPSAFPPFPFLSYSPYSPPLPSPPSCSGARLPSIKKRDLTLGGTTKVVHYCLSLSVILSQACTYT